MDNTSPNRRVAARHRNNGLFADYYLDEIVPGLPEWDEVLFAEGKRALDALRDLRGRINPAALDESQLEEQWVKPVLAALGHFYSVQVKIRYRDSGFRKPDYVLVGSEADAHALTNAIYAPAQIAHALAVADAKKWAVNLDQSAPGQRNPAQQIDEYLRYSELPWGILTDGRFWRLYHRDTSKYNSYYAVDLETLIDHGSTDDFLYFYGFFRRQAFVGGWLAKVLAGSGEFAERLTDTLENEVFDALELIAQGFLDYRRNRLTGEPERLREIYEQSLVLLYRLLFVFFAESREILPINRNADYTRARSLSSIKHGAATDIDFNNALDADGGGYYNQLRDLFFAIDAGNSRLDIPAYNGRLFSADDHRFLEQKTIGDTSLVPALDRLARVDAPGGKRGRVFVDYRDLDVRHLGSIYEKLLEYELDIATGPLTLKGGKYAAAAPGDAVVKQAGQVYLRTGSNERKITGSYYTPDYIVRFIVEKTLEPLLTEITARYATFDPEGHWNVHEPTALVAAVLGLNVLDPATGSGHFAVDATAYIAEWLRSLALRPADIGQEDELLYWKRQVAGACIYAVDLNPLAVELAKLSMWLTTLARGKPLSFLDHHLRVGNSLVGATLADIRADLDDAGRQRRAEKLRAIAAESGQMGLFDDAQFADSVRSAVGEMSQIEATVAEAVSDVKQQEATYAAMRQRLSGWERAANVWTARDFGLELTADEWKAVRALTTTGQTSPRVSAIVAQAEALAARKDLRFFHWELAFPEVFFDAAGQKLETPGFDAVIGNPPYVRQERIQPVKPYLEKRYAVYSGTADLFLYFYERGLEFLKPGMRLGYITSGTYMNSNSAKPFREYIHANAALEWVANFGENQPFKGAEMVYPTIAVMRRDAPRETFRNLFVEGVVRRDDMGAALASVTEWTDSLSEVTAMDEWRFQAADLSHLYGKVTANHNTLAKFIGNQIYYGIKSGFNDAFVIDDATRDRLIREHLSSTEIIKPLLRGQDLRPWYSLNSGVNLIVSHQGIEIEQYPAIMHYLQNYRERLEPKPSEWDDRKDGEWGGRSSGSYEWYELQTSFSYAHVFAGRKIFLPDIAKLPRFSLSDHNQFVNDTGAVIVPDSTSVLALLNSRVLWFAFSQIAIPLRLRAGLWQYRAKLQFIRRLPIPDLTAQQDSDLAAIAEEITGLARRRYALHEDMRHRLSADLVGGQPLNEALSAWWQLADGSALRAELKKAFKSDIPLRDRSEWDGFLASEQSKHADLTAQIVALETRLNAIVYDAFDLSPDERDLIERATQYPYGAV